MSVQLTNEQQQLINSNAKYVRIVASPGSGKAVSVNTGVYIFEDGKLQLKRAGDVKLNDIGVDRFGNFTTFTGIFPQGKKTVWEVEFSDGNIIECCKDHLWMYQTVSMRNAYKRGISRGWNMTEWLVNSTEEINQIPIFKPRDVNGIRKHNIYIPMSDPVQIPQQETPLDSWLVGFYIGNGILSIINSKKYLVFSLVEEDLKDKLLKMYSHELNEIKILKNVGHKKGIYYTLRFSEDSSLFKIIEQLNLLNLKSYERFIPEIYKQNSPEVRFSILQGLIDADGSTSIGRNSSPEFVTSSKILAEDVAFICESLGFNLKLEIIEANKKYNRERNLPIRLSYRIRIKPSEKYFKCYTSKRHLSNYKKPQTYARRSIVRIEKTNRKEEMICFQVDSPDKTFLLEHFIVTHNTTTLVSKIEDLIQKGSDPKRMLICTFTNKAAKEIKSRINAKFIEMGKEINVDDLWVSTIHSACVKLLRRYSIYIKLNKNFGIADETKQNRIIKKCWEKYQPQGTSKEDYMYKISYIKNQSLTFYDHPDFNKLPKFREIFDEYHELLKKENLLDFDDLLIYTNKLLDNFLALQQIQYLFDLIMVDEVQDINLVQYEIFKKIALAPHIRYIIVGDDDQCIYSFRGSDPKYLMHNFANDFSGSQVIYLSINHRCPANVVRLSEQIVLPVTDRMKKSLNTIKGDSDPIIYTIYADQEIEAEGTINRLFNIVKTNHEIYDNCAILFRTQRQSRVLEEICMKRSIPYKVIGALNFYDRREVKDILAFLRIISGRHNNDDVERIINTPARGIGDTSIKKLKSLGDNLYETLKYRDKIPFIKGKLAIGLDEFMNIINKYNLHGSENPKLIGENIIKYINEIDYYKKVYPNEVGEKLLMRKGNVEELILSIQETLTKGKTLEEYFDYILDMESDDEDNKRGVSLMTMHAAKGLEFDNVFLVGVQDGLVPHSKSITIDEINSERRLLYVAMTRSKKRLYISSYADKFDRFNSNFILCSFLDLPNIHNLVEIIDIRDEIDLQHVDLGYEELKKIENKNNINLNNKIQSNRIEGW